MNLAKGALGGGVLAGHVAYMTGGLYPSMCLNVIYGFFMCYSFYTLAMCGQRLCRRCHVASMTYPDIAEASCALFPNPKIARCSFCFRLYVDLITCLDLFGACAAYQLMVAKTIKQLVEGLPRSSIEGQNALCLATAVHYAIKNNPGFTGMVPAHNFEAVIKYTGMAVFSMSTAGVAIPVENNMKDPKKFPFVMFLVVPPP
ncbi:proton-coupled amino acid transporter-like protein pathetic [Leguminivora glycinivorella]|uniref:proton-coupled amino acid transporter-like protein pathetic n=1 Tax=Leguminivora glycinivorella TaxID=1035111 RepID=UPI00200F136D|nr:proton-coupled amino acid transporter-like protein pathetic [Leguminivora glycinivorella]